MKTITNCAFLLAMMSAAPVIGQDWVIPAASTNDATCGAPPFLVVTQTSGVSCGRLGVFPWYASGGGWTTGFTLSNPTGSDMAVQISFNNPSGNAESLTVTRNGTSVGALSSDAQTLPKYGSLRWVISPAASISGGEILVQVLAKDAASLETIQGTEDYSYTNPNTNVLYSTVTLPISWIDLAQTTYTGVFEESSADSSLGSFAIMDLTTTGQTVDVQAFDVNGNVLGDQKVNLTAGQVSAYVADAANGGLFKAGLFSSLSPVPYARLQFTGGGPIAVLLLQVKGQSLAASPTTAVLAK